MEKVAIAPMLDWSDRHYRYFMRQLTKKTTLYSEMVVADAIIHGDRDKLLEYNSAEHPLVLQLGGSNPAKLQQAAIIARDYGYDEINLNCGCPSDRVQAGCFGAALMNDATLVAECYTALQSVSNVPVTIKHRIGLDYDYNYDFVADFVATVAKAGCRKFIVHARNAVLKGLSPKENRDIPPLKYDYVYRLKQDFPDLEIMINGGIKTHAEINEHLQHIDSVMLGREAYYNPYLFAEVDQRYYGINTITPTRREVAEGMVSYLQAALDQGIRLHHITRHMIGLYHGCKKAKLWRQQLTTQIIKSNSLDEYIQLVAEMEA